MFDRGFLNALKIEFLMYFLVLYQKRVIFYEIQVWEVTFNMRFSFDLVILTCKIVFFFLLLSCLVIKSNILFLRSTNIVKNCWSPLVSFQGLGLAISLLFNLQFPLSEVELILMVFLFHQDLFTIEGESRWQKVFLPLSVHILLAIYGAIGVKVLRIIGWRVILKEWMLKDLIYCDPHARFHDQAPSN